MEFFQKLGYSREDVVRVLGKLGEGALVNDVLRELIQTGSRPGAGEGSGAPLLVPRGSCAALDSVQRRPVAELEEDCGGPAGSLRPIVIDGSNVAMRYFPSSCSLRVGRTVSLSSGLVQRVLGLTDGLLNPHSIPLVAVRPLVKSLNLSEPHFFHLYCGY